VAGQKAFCYVVRTDRATPQLLVFASLDEPGYEVVKGAVETGETFCQAALREVHEEAGITAVAPVRELGVTSWHGEEQRFWLLRTTTPLPDRFAHEVTGEGIDRGFEYRFRWLDVTRDLHHLLVQGGSRFVDELIQACNDLS
jgi:8-oxo-dGTP pyrophosphatase MutT (NUDIX family)